MKFLLSLIIIIFTSKECNNNSNSSEENLTNNTEVTSKSNQLQENITFEYTALSRRLYNRVVISSSVISIEKGRDSEAVTKTCSKGDWSELMNLIDAIDLKNISSLKAPTQARLYDGAAIAQLTITQKNASFETKSFDHGKPPLEIEALVKKILSLSENIE